MTGIRQIKSDEYGALQALIETLPEDESAGLRSLLAEKYYAYLDRLMQLKMALREYDRAVGEVQKAILV